MGGTSADVCLVEAALPCTTTAASPACRCRCRACRCTRSAAAAAASPTSTPAAPCASARRAPAPTLARRATARDEATVTDAHVALGHLGADTLLGGGFPIDVDAAVRALERLGEALGIGRCHRARHPDEVADVTMARAMLVITAERAIDPATVPLVAYGGAGGLHAAGLMARLGLPKALLPTLPGAFSALGLALAGEAVSSSSAHAPTGPAPRCAASPSFRSWGARSRCRPDARP
jgi:N-methylhydantoinase A/oxoprolinase/acetone carboxylase beta subunit